jgi:hypothetical protein
MRHYLQPQLLPVKPFVVDSFDKCEGLSRIAFLEGNGAVMLGKITKVKSIDHRYTRADMLKK